MRKVLTYLGFIIASLIIILVFVTAQTYTQLVVAIVLYIPFAYFTLRIFPRKNWKAKVASIELPTKSAPKRETKEESVEIADIDKRAFLKLVGATGLSFFVFSLLGQGVQSLLFGRALGPGISTPESIPAGGTSAQALPMEGYKISEIDEGSITYYGFINKDGGWLIMKEDMDTSSFRYAKGDLNFPASWAKRENLKYDYFYKLF